MLKKTKDNYPHLEIGDYTYGNPVIDGEGLIKIGKFCSIASNVTFIMEGHNSNWFTTYPFPANELNDEWPEAKCIDGHPFRKSGIIIGNDVWIGRGATILSGVKIGDGAIISACSFVSGNVKPYSIVGGNPAQKLFMRFEKEIIDVLLSIKWWDWPINVISENLNMLCSNKYEDLISLYNKYNSNRIYFANHQDISS